MEDACKFGVIGRKQERDRQLVNWFLLPSPNFDNALNVKFTHFEFRTEIFIPRRCASYSRELPDRQMYYLVLVFYGLDVGVSVD